MHSLILEIGLFACIALAGGFIQGSSGLGFGIVTAGIFTLLLNVTSSTILILAVTQVIAISVLWRYGRQIVWKDIGWVLIGGIPARILAQWFDLRVGSPSWLKLALGILLIILALYSAFGDRLREEVRLNAIGGIIIGAVGSFVGGVFGIGGTVFALYFLWRYQDTKNYTATMQCVFFILNIESLALFGLHDEYTIRLLLIFIAAALGAALGVYLGLKLFEKLDRRTMKRVVQALVAVNGVFVVVSTLMSL